MNTNVLNKKGRSIRIRIETGFQRLNIKISFLNKKGRSIRIRIETAYRRLRLSRYS